jgi:hypothetical protein
MDARSLGPLVGLASIILLSLGTTSLGQFGRQQQFAAGSTNFIVFASSPEWAAQVAEMAELNRRNLAVHWLGKELPQWSERVPIHVEAGENLGAGGETRFSLLGNNSIGQWMMIVSGTQERILDSVLPHEITHTIFATHFAHLGKYVPRWADEGACTTVEHISEKKKHQDHLSMFLKTRRGLPFNQMFSLKEYPPDIMPLYAQGHSAVQFLIDQGGPQKFVKFLEAGMRSEVWPAALREYYAYESIGQFQTLWNQWLADGSPADLLSYAPGLQPSATDVASQPLALASASAQASSGTLLNSSALDTTSVMTAALHAPTAATVQLASLAGPISNSRQPSSQQPNSRQLGHDGPVGNRGPESYDKALGNENWYKRRLREVSGAAQPLSAQPLAAPTISPKRESGPDYTPAARSGPSVDAVASQPRPATRPPQAVGHGPQSQGVGIQVLDWGASAPVPGIQPTLRLDAPAPEMVPLYR